MQGSWNAKVGIALHVPATLDCETEGIFGMFDVSDIDDAAFLPTFKDRGKVRKAWAANGRGAGEQAARCQGRGVDRLLQNA